MSVPAELSRALSGPPEAGATPAAVVLIVNPAAGGGRAGRRLPDAEAALRAAGLRTRTEHTASLEHARELARAAAAEGAVAATLGGDGLVGAVAGALRGTDGLLGVLPGGRGNDFARVVGIPRDVREAVAVIAAGRVATLDLACAGGHPYVGIASLGFDSEANRIANEARLVRGNLVYAYAGLRALAAWRPARFELELDGQHRSLMAMTIGIANSKAYGGGMYLAPDARLDDGLLDVVIIRTSSRLAFLRGLPRVFKGTHVEMDGIEVVRVRRVHIDADRPFEVYADGDPVGRVPMSVEVLPAAVRVLVP